MRMLRLGTGLALALLIVMVVAPVAPAQVGPGELHWSQRSARPGNDAGRAVAVDPAGDFVIATDLLTDTADSSLLWFALTPAGGGGTSGVYGDADGLSESANALALGAGGAPFLAGSITGTLGRTDCLLARFNADGSLFGAATYDGPSQRNDTALAIAVDPSGASYVTGSSQSGRTAGDQDIVTIKYDAVRDKVWAKRFDGSAHGLDRPAAIAVRSGYVYVAGRARRTGHADDVVLIKYNANTGATVWTAYYDDTKQRNERVTDLVVTSGGVYVGGFGRSGGTSTADALLLKFGLGGSRSWARYTGGNAGLDVWNDLEWSAGALRATGTIFRATTGGDVMTAAWRPDGSIAWRKTWTTLDVLGETGVALTTDTAGDTYVACSCENDTDLDIRVLAYGPDGDTLWASAPFGYFAGEADVPADIAVSGTTVAVVGTSGTPAEGDDYLVLGYQK